MVTRGFTRLYKIQAGLIIFLAALSLPGYADTLYLKNGHTIEGIIKGETDNTIELEVCGGIVKFSRPEVASIEKSTDEDSEKLLQKWERQKDAFQHKIARQKVQELSKPKEIELVHKQEGIVVKAKLNRKVDVDLILDTGATFVMIRKKVAQDLGIKLDNAKPDTKMKLADGREVDGKHVVLESVTVESAEAKNVEATVLLDEGGTMNFGDGLLGMSFLKNFKFTLDHKNNKVVLEKP